MPGEAVTCAIHQPNLLPRLSTLAKLYAADHWVVLDDVQFTRRDYQHRCRLAPPGEEDTKQRWLTLPVRLEQGRATVIKDVTLVDPVRDRARVPSILRQCYTRAAYAEVLDELIAEVGRALEHSNALVDVAEASTLALLRLLGWSGQHVRSSSLTVRAGRSDRLADLTGHVGADHYLCGSGGARYLDEQPFTHQGLAVQYVRVPADQDGVWQQARRLSCVHALVSHGALKLSELLHNWTTDHAARVGSNVPSPQYQFPSEQHVADLHGAAQR